ncbi:MAG: hypothetical protein M0D55_07830 [Elusimicrobiota bacterium]|nr:MAG: hypothetical protein M0D55_07830 [Elusimicrobiota bacterium]
MIIARATPCGTSGQASTASSAWRVECSRSRVSGGWASKGVWGRRATAGAARSSAA